MSFIANSFLFARVRAWARVCVCAHTRTHVCVYARVRARAPFVGPIPYSRGAPPTMGARRQNYERICYRINELQNAKIKNHPR